MWTFWGNTFAWGKDREGNFNLSLYVAWHEPLPDMTGPSPAFEVDEVLRLKALDLSLRFRSGGMSAARAEVAAHYRWQGEEIDENNARDFSSVIYVLDSHIELQAYLCDEELSELVRDFHTFGSQSGPKHFVGHFGTRILVGPRFLSVGVQPNEKGDFLAGQLPGVLTDLPVISFVSGRGFPPKSDDSSTLSQMRQQF